MGSDKEPLVVDVNRAEQERRCPDCGGPLAADALLGLCPVCLLRQGTEDTSAHTQRPRARTTPPGLLAPAPADLVPLFPQLEIMNLLGQGGMGAVYRCRQIKLDRPVALKVLPDDAQRDAGFADRFAREARALARLDHAGIVHIHDFGDAAGLHYFIMEYVDGTDLRQLLMKGPLAVAQCLSIIDQIGDALQYAHDEGVVHRDIKPENILLDRRGRVRLADFGLAKLASRSPQERSLTGTHQVMGTPHYMAPEQFEKPNQVDHRADIYALGVVCYEMLTGELPLGQFVPPSHKSQASAQLDAIVLRALAREPERRFQSVAELRQALADLHGPAPTVPRGARSASVPFHCPLFISELEGRVHVDGQELVLEYRRVVLSMASLPIRETRIALQDIDSIQVSGNWSMTIVLQTRRLADLARVPSAHNGRFEMRIRSVDYEAAGRFCAALNRVLGRDVFPPAEVALNHLLELQVRLPAAFLMMAGLATAIHGVVLTSYFLPYMSPDWAIFFALGMGEILAALLMMLGGRRMLKLRSYELAVLGAACACLPISYASFAAVPIGIWCLWVLLRQEVKLAFLDRAKSPPATPAPAGPVERKARSILGNLYSLMFESRVRPEDERDTQA